MSSELITDKSLSKEEKYKLLIPQITALTKDEKNLIANLSNITAALMQSMDNFLWTGFYLTNGKNKKELVLGPFQGRVACTRIPFGKGVCGTSAEKKKTIIVDDVDKFPGHIICDSLSRSEIVVPVISGGEVKAVLDIDSGKYNNFDETDEIYLEKIAEIVKHFFDESEQVN